MKKKKHDPFQIISDLNSSLKSLATCNQDSSEVLVLEKEYKRGELALREREVVVTEKGRTEKDTVYS
jgi:hypothetical protein